MFRDHNGALYLADGATKNLAGYSSYANQLKSRGWKPLKKGEEVPVVIWETQESDEQALDRYEGCPQFYYKKEMIIPIKGIKSKKTRIRKAYVYIMHEDRKLGIPSVHYLRTCYEGYMRFNFDPLYLLDALDKSRRLDYEEGN